MSATRTVDGPTPAQVSYGFPNRGRTVLGHGTAFAVVRWTNLYFPAKWWFFGDWFGGPLQPLYGKGIKDIPITGNTPGRWAPAVAHGRYFSYPEETGPNDVATLVRTYLDLNIDDKLAPLRQAPAPIPETDPASGDSSTLTTPTWWARVTGTRAGPHRIGGLLGPPQ